jgi:hypothetical protein
VDDDLLVVDLSGTVAAIARLVAALKDCAPGPQP